MPHAVPLEVVAMEMPGPSGVLRRTIVIGLTAFLTVVDLLRDASGSPLLGACL